MIRPEIRYLIDIVSLVTFIINAFSGYILWFVLPPGTFRFLGVDRYDWRIIHDHSSLVFTAAIVLHFVINSNWIIRMTKRIFKPRKSRTQQMLVQITEFLIR
jgi:hypothetical protein